MPREIDLTTFTTEQLNLLAQQPGPTGNAARQYLTRGGKGSASSVPQDKGNLAYNLLTDEQKATVDAQVTVADNTSKVQKAENVLAKATAEVAAAVQAAQEVISQAGPVEGVDTSSLEQAVAAVQPVVDSAAPVTPDPVAEVSTQ